MFNNKKLNQITGIVLVLLTIASAVLAMGGVWGVVDDETGRKLFATFAITAATTWSVAAIADKFWKGW
ncbi:MAG: hypothetical protein EBR82_28185 [Caulobacteraceae bacterium]|nr:hypothetical protein [Caulobacteraceae bacterium]